MRDDMLYTECNVATMAKGEKDYGLIHDAAFVVQNQKIEWVGKSDTIPEHYAQATRKSLEQRLVTPALIDCHAHLVFGGNRAKEFELLLNGASYQDIAKAGGGIMSTVSATRAATDQELLKSALRRVDDLLAEGVAVIEVKSGYGLTIDHELRMLRVARQLQALRPVKICTTWLAAHAVPAEYQGDADSYIDQVAIPGLKQAVDEGLVDAVDGFCENIGFSFEQIQRLFDVADSLGLRVKIHAEQLSDQRGALLAARYKCLSADHLEYLPSDDVAEFAKSGAVAVMLPGAYYTLGETKIPPIDSFRSHGVDMAVATDCNPGSSPISSILTAMNMACTQFSITPEEALAGATRCAAKALGLDHEYGVVLPGHKAELAVWDVEHPAELAYWLGGSPLFKRIC